MTDRELLELAAKAGGYEASRWTDDGTALLLVGVQQPWNSLHENPHSDCMGDALRLAVKVGITVYPPESDFRCLGTAHVRGITISETGGADPCAATRRAVTRAAAEIGRRA